MQLAPLGGVEQWFFMVENMKNKDKYRICAPPEYFGSVCQISSKGKHLCYHSTNELDNGISICHTKASFGILGAYLLR